jgi:iron complex outermembrane recepter protein
VELESRLLLGGGHSAFVNYAYSRATFQVGDIELFSIREEAGGGENEIEPGDRLPLVPAHTFRAGTDLLLPGGFEVGLIGRYTGARWLRGDEANEEEPLDGFFVADARAAYAVAGWRVQLTVRNLLDARYATFGTFNIHQAAGDVLERFLTPAQPRTLRVTLVRSFGAR